MPRFFIQFLTTIFVILNGLLLTTLALVIFLPFKTLVFILARIFRSDLVRFTPALSSTLAQEDIFTKPRNNLCIFFVFDSQINIHDLRSKFQDRVLFKLKQNGKLVYPELKQYWTSFFNYTFWKEDRSFSLKNHIRLYDFDQDHDNDCDHDQQENQPISEDYFKLPKENEGFCNERDLSRIMGPLFIKPWIRGRSPWEILLVNNFQACDKPYSHHSHGENENGNSHSNSNSKSSASSVLIFRLHHGLGDGYTVMKLICRDLMLKPLDININFPKWTFCERLVYYLTLPFKLPWDLAEGIINSVDGNHFWHGWGKDHEMSRSAVTAISRPVDTKLIKKIKDTYGVSYNAVLCFIVVRSYHRLMEAAGQKIPKEMSFMIPIPLPNHPDGAVNHVTMHCFKCPMNVNLTFEERLRLISKRISPSKFYLAPLAHHLQLAKLGSLLPNFMLKLNRVTAFSAAISALPIPLKQMGFDGIDTSLVEVFCGIQCAVGTTGATTCTVALGGRQRFTVVIDQTNFPWKELLMTSYGDYIEEELTALIENSNGKHNVEKYQPYNKCIA